MQGNHRTKAMGTRGEAPPQCEIDSNIRRGVRVRSIIIRETGRVMCDLWASENVLERPTRLFPGRKSQSVQSKQNTGIANKAKQTLSSESKTVTDIPAKYSHCYQRLQSKIQVMLSRQSTVIAIQAKHQDYHALPIFGGSSGRGHPQKNWSWEPRATGRGDSRKR